MPVCVCVCFSLDRILLGCSEKEAFSFSLIGKHLFYSELSKLKQPD